LVEIIILLDEELLLKAGIGRFGVCPANEINGFHRIRRKKAFASEAVTNSITILW
jgi:hypothetical protein